MRLIWGYFFIGIFMVALGTALWQIVPPYGVIEPQWEFVNLVGGLLNAAGWFLIVTVLVCSNIFLYLLSKIGKKSRREIDETRS